MFSLTSPIAGIVIERNATIGATVGSDANVFKIIDISRVWIDANVFEKDLERVRLGQEVKVKVPAFPGVELFRQGHSGFQRRGSGDSNCEGSHRSAKPRQQTQTGHVCQCGNHYRSASYCHFDSRNRLCSTMARKQLSSLRKATVTRSVRSPWG